MIIIIIKYCKASKQISSY